MCRRRIGLAPLTAGAPRVRRGPQVLLLRALKHAEGARMGGAEAAAASPPQPVMLGEADLWSMAWSRRLGAHGRDLLAVFPALRAFLRSSAWPERLNFGFTRWVFPLAVALLLLGPQARGAAVPLLLLQFRACSFACSIQWRDPHAQMRSRMRRPNACSVALRSAAGPRPQLCAEHFLGLVARSNPHWNCGGDLRCCCCCCLLLLCCCCSANCGGS